MNTLVIYETRLQLRRILSVSIQLVVSRASSPKALPRRTLAEAHFHTGDKKTSSYNLYRKELLSVATVAVAMLESIELRDKEQG